MAVANQPLAASLRLEIGMAGEELGDLGLDRLRQQATRPAAQDLGEPVLECSWLNQTDNVIVGHGISLLRWRSEVVKQPHDMPPSRFDPSPTSGDSSQGASIELLRCETRLPQMEKPDGLAYQAQTGLKLVVYRPSATSDR